MVIKSEPDPPAAPPALQAAGLRRRHGRPMQPSDAIDVGGAGVDRRAGFDGGASDIGVGEGGVDRPAFDGIECSDDFDKLDKFKLDNSCPDGSDGKSDGKSDGSDRKLVESPKCVRFHRRIELRSSGPPRAPAPLLDSSWVISIQEELRGIQQNNGSFPLATLCMYRVPKSLFKVDWTAYRPKIVSIGPYNLHHHPEMDGHKCRALNQAITRANHDLCVYINVARSLEDRARACYEALPYMNSNHFVYSLVLDAIFTLELFRGVAGKNFQTLGYAPNDSIFTVCRARRLQSDMIMLENQLPLFVLEEILAVHLGHNPSPSDSVASLALLFFKDLRPTDEHSSASFDSNAGSSEALHCLDVFHRSLILAGEHGLPSDAQPVPDELPLQFIPCVTELYNTGMDFRHRESHQFWDITFEDGVLHIPRLFIKGGTKSLFRNLIAFEDCHFKCSNRITFYVFFMGNLIKSEVDVGHLRHRKIIEHCLRNDGEVADLFNELCKELVFDRNESYMSELLKQVNDYYKSSPKKRINYYKVKCQKWIATLREKYLSSPWAIISLIFATVLLLLAALQSFYAAYGYYKPNH